MRKVPKKYRNTHACNNFINTDKCTKTKLGRTVSRNKYNDAVYEMTDRIEKDKTKYAQRKSIVEHPFGTLKRSMNFTYLLLRNLTKVKGEVSLAFFSYNLKRVINIFGVKKIIGVLYAILNKLIDELNCNFYNLIHLECITI